MLNISSLNIQFLANFLFPIIYNNEVNFLTLIGQIFYFKPHISIHKFKENYLLCLFF